jgi:hypothetical protein
MNRDDIHTCSYSCERPACIKAQRDELAQRLFELVAQAVAAEREACALVAESYEPTCETCPSGVANAIRARGEV